MSITHISDTAHWVAMYRALRLGKPDLLFDELYARRMAGAIGNSTVCEVPHGESMVCPIIVRNTVMDEVILDCIDKGATKALNLGAALDTRVFRLKLPPALRWFDVDLPGMVAHRRSCLENLNPRCEHAHIAADVNDAAELNQVLGNARKGKGSMLVVSEGLLVYLESAQVRVLAEALHAEEGARWWLADLVSPMLLGIDGLQLAVQRSGRKRTLSVRSARQRRILRTPRLA